MANAYLVACPNCSFEFPVDDELLKKGADAHCPRCHHEWKPDRLIPLGREELQEGR